MPTHLMFEAASVFKDHPDDFDPMFRTWLRENWSIYADFHNMAKKMCVYREHYSARTLIENIRWHTDLRETDKLFKINNNITPDMARMFNRITGTNFFNERSKTNGNVERPAASTQVQA